MTRLAENLGSTNDVSEACMFHEAASPSRRWSSNSPRLRLRWKLSSVHRLTSSQAHARSIPASQVDERSVLITSWGEPFPWRLLAHPSRLRRTLAARLESRRSTAAYLEKSPLKAPFPSRARCRTCRLARSSRSIASWVATTRHACDLYPRVTRFVGLALVETLDACLDRLI